MIAPTYEQILADIASGRFYKTGYWKAKRKKIIDRDKECQRCKRKGKVGKAEVVHHKKHLDEYPELALDDDNLEAICAACHNEEHPEKLNKAVGKRNPAKKWDDERW